MDRPIIININMFDMAQSIYLPNGKINYTYRDSLGEIIPELCHEYGVYKVEIHGPLNYTQRLIEEIKKEELVSYNENKIEIKGVQN